MEYLITKIIGDERTIISRHNTKDEAMQAGKIAWDSAEKGAVISCISGNTNSDGKIIGKYTLHNTWF